MMDSGLLSLKWNNHGSTFLHVLTSIRRKESYTDVTITCDGKFYPVHKLVLSTCSEYFEEIFERTQCKHPVIVLKDIKHEELEALLNYMYLGEVNVLQAELAGLIKAAECLKIKGLAVPDEAPLPKSESTRENKRSAKDSSSSGGPIHKRPRPDDNIRSRQDDDIRLSPSQSSHSYKSHQKESSREPRVPSSQSSSEGGFTSPSFRSPNQASEGTRERRVTAETNRLNDNYGKKDSSSNSSQPVVEVLVEDTPTVKKEIIEEPIPKEEEEDILNSDSSLAYDSIAPGMGSDGDGQNVFNQHMSAGPQGIEDLVAQSLPGPSSVQGDSLMGWAGGGGGGGGSAGNFSLEGFPLDDSSQGGAAQGGQQMNGSLQALSNFVYGARL